MQKMPVTNVLNQENELQNTTVHCDNADL